MQYLIALQQKYLHHAARTEKRWGADHPAVIFYKEAALHITPLLEQGWQKHWVEAGID